MTPADLYEGGEHDEFPDPFTVVTKYDPIHGHCGLQILSNKSNIARLLELGDEEVEDEILTHRLAILGSSCQPNGTIHFADVTMLMGLSTSTRPVYEGTHLLQPNGTVCIADEGFEGEYMTGYIAAAGITNFSVRHGAIGTTVVADPEQWLETTVLYLDELLKTPVEGFDVVTDPIVMEVTGNKTGELLRDKSYHVMSYIQYMLSSYKESLDFGHDVGSCAFSTETPDLAFTFNGLVNVPSNYRPEEDQNRE